MKSEWYEFKPAAIAFRRQGMSLNEIERRLGVPRSTLAGWLRKVPLTDQQQQKLAQGSRDGWKKARQSAAAQRRFGHLAKHKTARTAALMSLAHIKSSLPLLELFLATHIQSQNTKNNQLSFSSHSPEVLVSIIAALRVCTNELKKEKIGCHLKLHPSQTPSSLIHWWSVQLQLPVHCFSQPVFDKRLSQRTPDAEDKGICTLTYQDIALQRKLVYLYNLFCQRVAQHSVAGD